MEQEVYDFGLRLKRLREYVPLTQQELADKLGVTVWSIKKYEKNEQLPPVDKLEVMALLFRTSLDYLRNLDKRQSVYIDDLPHGKQEMILEIISSIRKEHNKAGN